MKYNFTIYYYQDRWDKFFALDFYNRFKELGFNAELKNKTEF